MLVWAHSPSSRPVPKYRHATCCVSPCFMKSLEEAARVVVEKEVEKWRGMVVGVRVGEEVVGVIARKRVCWNLIKVSFWLLAVVIFVIPVGAL